MTDSVLVTPPVQVALIGLVGLLRDIVNSAVAEQRDMKVVAETGDDARAAATLEGAHADVAIWQMDSRSIQPARVLELHPRLKILTVEGDGRTGSIWELRPFLTAVGELSPALLVDTIRRVAR